MYDPDKIIASSGVPAKKVFGQHFLNDSSVLHRIIALCGGLEQTHVVEVGPGPATLTQALLASDAASITGIEIDARFYPHLETVATESGGRFRLMQQDALEVDLTKAVVNPCAIVSNLPYNVGTALLLRWLETVHATGNQAISMMVLMFQKEVADRVAAVPGTKDYGRLSVLSQWLCDVQEGFDIPPESFTPPPKVTSSVVRLIPHARPIYDVRKVALEKVLAAGFNQRRKMLRSALKSLNVNTEALLDDAEINPEARAETLTVKQWCRLGSTYDSLYL